MDEINLYEKLCLNFCPYYKPAKKKDLACMGFLILERLVRKGNEIPFEKGDKKVDIITRETLMQNMCIACPFYEDDCDFIQQKEKSLPCGGFVLLGHLLKANIITIDNIKDMIFQKKGGGMVKFSILEVIEQAVQTEKLGNEFYAKMAKRFQQNNELKKLFEILASQELEHEKTFSELKNKIGDEEPEGWEEVSLYLRAIVDSEFFLGKGKSMSVIKSMKTAAGAINFALGFERETLLYYHAMRDAIKEKKIVDAVINEEKSHIVWLNDLRKSFV